MPIYEYRCAECSFQDEYLQKVSEPPMTVCPSCGKESFRKLLSAAGFQLKGSGWYATDFRNKGSGKSEAKADKAEKGEKGESDRKDGAKKSAESSSGESSGADSKSGSDSGVSSDTKSKSPTGTTA